MCFLGKLFGRKKEEKRPTTHEAIQKLRETVELLIIRQDLLESKLETEIQTARKNEAEINSAAIAGFKRQNSFEKQVTHIESTLAQIERVQQDELKGVNTNAQVLNTMKDAANAMKLDHKDINVKKVNNIVDVIAEQHDMFGEITNGFTNYVPYVWGSTHLKPTEGLIQKHQEEFKPEPEPESVLEYEDPDTVHLVKFYAK